MYKAIYTMGLKADDQPEFTAEFLLRCYEFDDDKYKIESHLKTMILESELTDFEEQREQIKMTEINVYRDYYTGLYLCPFDCGRTFTRSYAAKSHLICHTNERNFKCNECEYASGRKHDLNRHVKSLHSVNSSPVKRRESPVKRSESPVKSNKSPVKRNESPVKRRESPVKRRESPVKRSESPVKRNESPVKRCESPVKRSESPVKRCESPVKRSESPVKRGELGVKRGVSTIKKSKSKKRN